MNSCLTHESRHIAMNTKKKFIQGSLEISQESIEHGWTMPYAHYHEDYEIYILKTGERTVMINDVEYLAPAHSATLFSKNAVHRSWGETPFSGICIHFSERYLKQYFTPMAISQLLHCFEQPIIKLSDEAYLTIQKMADEFVLHTPENFLHLATLLQLLCTCADSTKSALPIPHALTPTPSKTEAIIAYVNENYIDIKDIAELSERFNVSQSYIFRIFKQRFQKTPKHYINQLRIRTVCHRLKYSTHTIRSLATDCGFESYEYFHRVFKELMGCTPNEYRNKKQ